MNNLASLFSSMFTRRLVRFNSLILRFDEVRFFLFSFLRTGFSEVANSSRKRRWRIFRCFERIGEVFFFLYGALIFLVREKEKNFDGTIILGKVISLFFLIVDRFRSIAIKEFRFLEKVDFQDFFRNFLEFYKKYKIFYKSVMMAIFEFTYYVKLRKIISIISRLIDFQTFI